MTRSPLFYPLNRGMDAEAGGAADLQTDVMRFMAIISMCLVAIFALVQSIPLAPTPAQVTTPPSPELIEPEPLVKEPVPPPPTEKFVMTRPQPKRIETIEDTVVLQRPVPKPVPRKPPVETRKTPEPTPVAASPAPARSPTSSEQKGFTLRFETDAALTRLVEREVVGLYAIGQETAQRMSVDSGNFSFWAASTPTRVHEMDVATVPASVLDAWRRSNGSASTNIKWGVSIPPSMSRQLNQHLAERSGGSLVIGADGALRLE
jgi:outer membrane biosynthesis protein TonB